MIELENNHQKFLASGQVLTSVSAACINLRCLWR